MWLPLMLMGLSRLKSAQCAVTFPWVELQHDPAKLTTTMTPFINGTELEVPKSYESPDFRLPEPPWTAYKSYYYKESHRPYRLNPYDQMFPRINKYIPYEDIQNLGCSCCTVFKRLTPLAGCAILTSRHILTTATSTEMVLMKYEYKFTLQNILGLWYETKSNLWRYNTSYYASVARIHYHPRYNFPDRTNRSHPLPCIYDLALWATTFNLIGGYSAKEIQAMPCKRGVSTRAVFSSTTHKYMEMIHVVGYQFVWDINRVPSPFMKYFIRTREGSIEPCPKIEWGWFHCLQSINWGKLGLDMGGLKFLALEHADYRQSGLVGINSISMKLRSIDVVNYFTVIERYPVLDWLYTAYMGRMKYRWLDLRFNDTQWHPPRVKSYVMLTKENPPGEEHVLYEVPWNR